jgi:hypothetical protein
VTCFDSQYIRRLTAFQLDACQALPLFADNPIPALKGLADGVQSVARSSNIDQPQNNNTKTVKGGTCTKPRGTPTDSGYDYTLTFCGQNPLFEAMTGYKTLDYSGTEIIGWEDSVQESVTGVALEIVFEPSGDGCSGGNPQCRAVLIPNLEAWVRSGDEAFNGADAPDLVMTGSTRKGTDVFGNYTTSGALPTFLAHWAPKFADIKTGRSWAYSRMIDCPDVDSFSQDACRFVAIDNES